MTDRLRSAPSESRDIVVVTVWIALVTGLVEAGGSVWLMKLGRRPGAWWDLFAVSPVFDLVLFGATGLVLTWGARVLGRPALGVVLIAYGFIAASIFLGLALPYQVHMAALLLLSAGVGFQGARFAMRHRESTMRFCHRTLTAAIAIAAVAFFAIVAGRPVQERIEVANLPDASGDAPDVVLIVIDALRADHLPTHGYERDTAPTLSRLAAEGVLFRAAYSASPYTGPSHASLLTGLYPSEHGVQWIERRPVLGREVPTISEALQRKGYYTAAISGNRFWFTREQGFGRGFHRFDDNYHTLGDAVMRTAYGRKLDEWVIPRLFEDYPWRRKATAVTDAALEWVAKAGERPFFLMLNYFDVHDPYLPPAPYRGWFSKDKEPGGVLNTYLKRYHPDLTSEQLQGEIDAYDGAIRYVDGEIARLVEGLRAARSGRDLVVVVTSDHGEAFGEHGAYIHANSLYREEIFVPLVIWAPGRVPSGFRSDAVVSNAALPATILELVGGAEVDRLGVASLVSAWQPGALPREPAFAEMERWEWNLETSPSRYGAIRSLIENELHLIRHDSLGTALYRWRDDPREAINLAARSEVADTLAKLLDMLEARLPNEMQRVAGS